MSKCGSHVDAGRQMRPSCLQTRPPPFGEKNLLRHWAELGVKKGVEGCGARRCLSMTRNSSAEPKYRNEKLVMDAPQPGNASQIWLKGFMLPSGGRIHPEVYRQSVMGQNALQTHSHASRRDVRAHVTSSLQVTMARCPCLDGGGDGMFFSKSSKRKNKPISPS